MRRAAALALIVAAGCTAARPAPAGPPETPLSDVKTVAVLPVFDRTGEGAFDGEEFGAILASELIKARGFRVVRPAALRDAGPAPRSVEDGVRLAQALKADAVLVAAVTEHDPYDPPRIALSVQLLRTASRGMSEADLDRLVQSGSWRRGPLEISRDQAGHWIAAFEEVYDARDERVRRKLVQYAGAQPGTDSGFVGEREFLAVQSRYFQFVSTLVLQRAFEAAAAP
jgi:hypothetical protein